jgi:hypothetical protein
MSPLMTYLTGFGLASGAGAKACIPVLALGAFHYTPYFELSDRWVWIASPPVMVVLAVMVIAEIVVDSDPDLGRFSDTVSYLPKLAAGFIAFAAATGNVDSSLLELSASGLLGAGTAGAVHWLRNLIRRPFRDIAEDVHEGVGKLASLGEAGVSTAAAGSAIVAPPLALVMMSGVLVGTACIGAVVQRRRVACVHPDCAQPIRPGALVCRHCGRDQRPAPAEPAHALDPAPGPPQPAG